jgi:c-di-GMP-binding flagellar brake protein YcgR
VEEEIMLKIMTEGESPDPSGEDRREYPRRDVHLNAEAMRLGNTINAHRNISLRLSVEDISDGGMGATADRELEPGERIAVYFPSHMGQHVYDLYGRVIRCDRREIDSEKVAYRIGLMFDALAA